jgi:hypothetical protein
MSRNRRDHAIRAGLHTERVAKNPRYYMALHDHLNYRDFGEPEYVDEAGRQYKVARVALVRTATPIPLSPTSASVTLYVRLPPGTEWFPANVSRVAVTLYPANSTKRVRHIVFRQRYISPQHRTGHILVTRAVWN